jgi:PAS domain S-box-containing protein
VSVEVVSSSVSPSLLKGVSQAIQLLLHPFDWDATLGKSLEILGRGATCARLGLWQWAATTEPAIPLQVWVNPMLGQTPDFPVMSPQRLQKFLLAPDKKSWLGIVAVLNAETLHEPIADNWILLVPVSVAESIVGFLGLEIWRHSPPWSAADIELLESFAQQLGSLLELHQHFAKVTSQSLAEQLQLMIRSVPESDAPKAQQSLRRNEAWLRRQNQVLIDLSRRKNQHRGDLNSTLKDINQAAAEVLEVARSSIWMYTPDRQKLFCLNLYQKEANQHTQGGELVTELYTNYFLAIAKARTLAADNARTDARTREFAENYLTPLGITGMLDAPIWLRGQMVGVVCNEHIGPNRHWTIEEQQFAASIADLVSLAMETNDNYRSEMALRDSENRLQSFFMATFEAVIIHDQGRIIDVNHAAETLLGYSEQQLIGMMATQLVPPEMQQLIIDRIRAPQDHPTEVTGLRQDGSTFIAEITAKSILYQGRPARVVGIRDITQRKQAELALAALNANLEQQVEERTAQLQQKMQELQELNQLKDVFLHAVSHDLRTPVMGTLLVLNNLLQPPEQAVSSGDTHPGKVIHAETPSSQTALPTQLSIPRSIIERMRDSQKRQQVLIDSLLETHAHEVTGIVLNRQPTQIKTFVDHILVDLEPLLTKNQAKVHHVTPDNLPSVNVDPIQLQRVYENLITNALKHNPLGLELTISAVEDDVHQFLICTLQDNGVGICTEQSQHLFDLYYRGKTSRHLKGIGLGLYLCRQIIAAHGGEIGVISAPGAGATFWFKLPLTI